MIEARRLKSTFLRVGSRVIWGICGLEFRTGRMLNFALTASGKLT
jgi:hypothetical protein